MRNVISKFLMKVANAISPVPSGGYVRCPNGPLEIVVENYWDGRKVTDLVMSKATHQMRRSGHRSEKT